MEELRNCKRAVSKVLPSAPNVRVRSNRYEKNASFPFLEKSLVNYV
jgi:hypothetical protein